MSMHGPFEISEESAVRLLHTSGNPSGLPNSDVVRPILNALEIARRPERRWVVAFPPQSDVADACLYHAPFEFVRSSVKPVRDLNHRKSYRDHWWIHGEARPAMLDAINELTRCIATPRVGKHRLFIWVPTCVLPSDATVAFSSTEDWFFGVLHSRLHELWALKTGTRLETRPRYTPTTCFETFPFPKPTDAKREAISEAARELDQLRCAWLNPPEWTREEILEFPGSANGPWRRYVHDPDARGIGTVRYPRQVPRDADCAKHLAKRTLTNLYNERPTWLDLAHRRLDTAVFAAYNWDPALTDDQLLEKLLTLNLERAAAEK